MSDLISRKAILKHIEKIQQGLQMMDDTHRASIIMNGMYLCEKAVMTQPSAQSELIRCKDCKHFIRNISCVGGTYDGCVEWTDNGNEIEVKPDGFCSYAERRENEVD